MAGWLSLVACVALFSACDDGATDAVGDAGATLDGATPDGLLPDAAVADAGAAPDGALADAALGDADMADADLADADVADADPTDAATPDAGLTCADLEADCAEAHRVCDEGAGDATCGACVEGYEAEGDDCVAIIQCDGALGTLCAEFHRACLEDEARCGDCDAGFFPDAATPEGACLAPGEACDADTPCPDGTDCLQLEAPVGGAAIPDGVCMPAPCAADAVWDSDAGACAALNDGVAERCADAGAAGVWPVTDFDGNPICRTLDGYFYDSTPSERRVRACDADDDGWVRRTAVNEIGAEDLSRGLNARCTLRTIHGVVLENESGQSHALDLVGGVQRLDLYEPDALDEQGVDLQALLALPDDAIWPAATLNPFTKACISRLADANANGVEDVAEHHGSDVREDAAWLAAFAPFTYFHALHVGRYEPPAEGQVYGTWHVAERSRCEGAFPLGYGAEANDWWRSCTRRRAATYTAGITAFDFADTACDAAEGACAPVAPRTGAENARGQLDHGLCTGDLDADPVAWRGMLHFSQFTCVEVVADAADAEDWQRPHTDLWTGAPADDSPLQLNRCVVDEAGAVRCAAETTDTLTDAQQGGATETLASEVVWVARRFANYDAVDDYPGGCVDEWVEHRDLCTGGGDDVLGYGHGDRFGIAVCDCRDPEVELPFAANQTGACEGQRMACVDAQIQEPAVGAIIYCDGIDNDCSGDEDEQAAEFCDGMDNDCDGMMDEGAGPGFACAPAGTTLIGDGPGVLNDDDSLISAERNSAVSRDFAISEREVTRAWAELIGVVDGEFGCDEADCPFLVDFQSALIFANVLSAYEGYDPCYSIPEDGKALWLVGQDCSGYRLPTNVEWEHAARAGGTWTPEDGDAVAWCGADADNHAACELEANPWGLCDVLGNAAEWVWDTHTRPEDDDLLIDGRDVRLTDETDTLSHLDRTLETGGDPVQVRGGAAGDAVCALGLRTAEDFGAVRHGFRLVRTVPTEINQVEPDSSDAPMNLDPVFDGMGRAEVNVEVYGAQNNQDRDYFTFTLTASAPVRVDFLPMPGGWTETLDAVDALDGPPETGRPAVVCGHTPHIRLHRADGDGGWLQVFENGDEPCASVAQFAAGGAEQLPAGTYLVELFARDGDNRQPETSTGRLVVRRGLADFGEACSENPWAAWANPAQPTLPGCRYGTCFDEAVPTRAGGIYEADGVGTCVRLYGVAEGSNNYREMAVDEPGGFTGFSFTVGQAGEHRIMLNAPSRQTCDDVPALRLRVYRVENEQRIPWLDLQEPAGTCPFWAGELAAGQYIALAEPTDPTVTETGARFMFWELQN
jgi:hypothetical protein